MPGANLKWVVAALCGLAVSPAAAQFSQYTQPGSLVQEPADLSRETLETAIEEARWRLGPVRIQPWLGFRDAGWYRNPDGLDDDTTDFSATGGAGARFYLPVGPKVFVALHALPEYVWWQKATERRRLNGRYGLGVFGYFNRLTVTAEGTRAEARSPLSFELPREVNHRQDRAELAAEVAVTRSLSLFAGFAETDYSVITDGDGPGSQPLATLDRTERATRGGVRWALGSKWTLGAGVERSETEFPAGSLDRGSRGTSPLLEARFESHRVTATADVVFRSLEAREGARFVAVDETTGGFRLEFPGNRLVGALYARRDLGLSVQTDYSHYVGDVVGLGATLELGERSELLLFAESRRNDFVTLGPGIAKRRDDLRAFGAEWSLMLGRSLRLVIGGSNSQLDSSLPGGDRDTTSVRAGFTLGGGGPWT